jgi:ferritin-like metal-binding protein YciE
VGSPRGMAQETPARDAKLIQYLNEAYGKERELETALRAHISMTTRDAYKKRLQDHLKETTNQAKGLERRIKALGGKADKIDLPGPEIAGEVASRATSAANKAVALAQGPLHMLRGTGEAEKLLKNAKTELSDEFEEIGNYLAIEELATSLNDKETAKLAREFRRQEERMAGFLQKLIPQLTKQVVKEEVPAKERRANGSSGRRTTARRTTASRSTSSNGRSRTASTSRSKPATSRAKSTTSRSKPASSRAKSTGTTKSTRSRASSSRSTSRASGSRTAAKKK